MEMKQTEEYTNRYGDVFVFTYDPETNTVLWQVKKGSFDHCRYGWDNDVSPNDNRYSMVDPSGGPYVSSGMDAKFLIKGLKGLYVDYMSINANGKNQMISVNVHLKPQPK